MSLPIITSVCACAHASRAPAVT